MFPTRTLGLLLNSCSVLDAGIVYWNVGNRMQKTVKCSRYARAFGKCEPIIEIMEMENLCVDIGMFTVPFLKFNSDSRLVGYSFRFSP